MRAGKPWHRAAPRLGSFDHGAFDDGTIPYITFADTTQHYRFLLFFELKRAPFPRFLKSVPCSLDVLAIHSLERSVDGKAQGSSAFHFPRPSIRTGHAAAALAPLTSTVPLSGAPLL